MGDTFLVVLDILIKFGNLGLDRLTLRVSDPGNFVVTISFRKIR